MEWCGSSGNSDGKNILTGGRFVFDNIAHHNIYWNSGFAMQKQFVSMRLQSCSMAVIRSALCLVAIYVAWVTANGDILSFNGEQVD